MTTGAPDPRQALRAGMKRMRDVRATIESEVVSIGSSPDGRAFTLQFPISGPPAALGSYVAFMPPGGPEILGQITEASQGTYPLQAGGIAPNTDEGLTLSSQIMVRMTRAEGDVLGALEDGRVMPVGLGAGFVDAPVRPATDREVAACVAAGRPGGATLEIGRASFAQGDIPVRLDASGFNRHTFLCGQSGSGKTYALGVLVERLLSETDLQLVILDPNSDFVRLNGLAEGVSPRTKAARRFAAAAKGVKVLRPDDGLRMRLSDLDPEAQARILLMDPLKDRAEFDLYQRSIEGIGKERYANADLRTAFEDDGSPEARDLLLRVRNLGVGRWGLWTTAEDRTAIDVLEERDWRALVVDLGTLGSTGEKAVVAETILARLWERRQERRPILVVIDEAHNVCPSVPGDALVAMSTALAELIAGEGRKFGLTLLCASQRPDKVHPNVLSQCENLVLMRMNSLGDLDHLRTVFSHVPPSLLDSATRFRQGESLIAGRIASGPTFARFGGRLSAEGGADVPTSWARAR